MKKISKQILSLLMALLILSTGIIPALAAVPVLTFATKTDSNNEVSYYAGTSPDIIATITGLTAEQSALADKIVWSVNGDSEKLLFKARTI